MFKIMQRPLKGKAEAEADSTWAQAAAEVMQPQVRAAAREHQVADRVEEDSAPHLLTPVAGSPAREPVPAGLQAAVGGWVKERALDSPVIVAAQEAVPVDSPAAAAE